MSSINDLIATMCPDGVELQALGDLGDFIRGRRITKGDFVKSGVGCIHYGEIYTRYGTTAAETFSFVSPELAARLRLARSNDLIIAATGENAEEVCKAVAWLGAEEIAIHDDCYLYRHSFDPTYISYVFQSSLFHDQKIRFAAGAKMVRVSGEKLAKIRVPVPPLEIQHEIAKILGTMESLEAELEAKLEAEMEARRRQYAYYRTALLSRADGEGSWRTVRLRDVADILVGYAFKSTGFSSDPTDTALVRGDNVGQGVLKRQVFKRWRRDPDDGLDRYELRGGDVVVAMDRPWIPAGLKWARIADGDLPALLVQRVARLRGRGGVLDQRFLGCVISSARFTAYVLRTQTGNTVPHLSGGQIGEYAFALPPIPEQIRIAEVVGSFDALVDDLASSLPAELRARRQQYAHYRDRLVSFDQAAA